MTNPRLLSLIQPETRDDPDVFIRMVNERNERLRKERQMAEEQRRLEDEHNKECLLCTALGAALAFLLMSIISILL